MIHATQLRKDYRMGDSVVHALAGVDLTIDAGEYVAITGASGSGKSTLMHILGCLDRPTSGVLEFNGQLVSSMRERRLATVRNQDIGFVFQTFNLVNRTSAIENVLLPLVYSRRRVSRKKGMEALDRVGLSARAKHTPSELSGGECQRVAIARAIVNEPKLLLADEPTGNLDSRTGAQIMNIFSQLNGEGITVVLVTHEMDVAAKARRMIHMRDGLIVEDLPVTASFREAALDAAIRTQHRLLRNEPGADQATEAAKSEGKKKAPHRQASEPEETVEQGVGH